MNMPRRVGHNPPIAGEITREPEIGAAALIRCDLVWMARVSERLPVFSGDNLIDRSGQSWCCGCGWQPHNAFNIDESRSRQQDREVFERRCRSCDAKRKAAASKKKQWKRGSMVRRGRPKRPTTPFYSEK